MTAHAVMVRVNEGPPQDLTDRAPNAPAELVAIVRKAMARELSRRYADTLELAGDLSAFFATKNANDVLSLSSTQDLEDLIDQADALWQRIPNWLRSTSSGGSKHADGSC
ncbi:MAG: hypothetical protein SGI72_14845 [Planctomycetota bacterium]|nr:hypothetical protein [Planctomycetota bacterium]